MLRRRGIIGDNSGGSSAPSYVTDGLIFHLDGINKGENPGYWTDLVGGIKFDISQNCTVNNDSIITDGTHSILGDAKIGINYTANEGVLEVCGSILDPVTDGVLFMDNGTNNSVGFGWDNAYVIGYGWVPSNAFTTSAYPDKFTFSTIFTSTTLVNGITMSKITKGKGRVNSNYCSLGGNQNSNFMQCKIYAIRVYNQPLTADDMLHNQQVDNLRFNLGLTI